MESSLLALPDSQFAVDATTFVRDVSSPMLYQHCLRTYYFGRALAQQDRLHMDAELFYLGAMMHDLGLAPQFAGSDPFEIEGAQAAQSFLLAHQYPPEGSQVVYEAIRWHLTKAAQERQPEIALVALGAGMDVTGQRLSDIPPGTIRAILAACPRLGLKEALLAVCEEEARKKPGSTIAKLMRLGMREAVLAAPFDE